MSDDTERMRQQLLAHLRQLRGAGVEWLPRGKPIDLTPQPVAAPTPILSGLDIAPETLSLASNLTLAEVQAHCSDPQSGLL